MTIPPYERYELHSIDHHQKTTGQTTWHQKLIPEYVYYASGYIKSWNEHRLKRIMKYRTERGDNTLLGDYGLDFMSYDPERGSYHGGQAKFYEEKRVTANDLGTFMSCVYHRLKTIGYLYTSRNKLEKNFKEDISGDDSKIKHIVLPFKPKETNNTRTINETELSLRPYQEESIRAVLDADTSKTMLKLTTGTGKTVVARHILKQSPQHTCFVCIAPLLFSVQQLQDRISPFLPQYHTIKVDSDSDGTTDIQEIKDMMKKHERTVLFSTFDSFEDVVSELDIDYDNTFLLIDEVHNCFNKHRLCEFANRYKHSLYLSATVPEELEEILEYEIVYEYNIRNAINDGYCVDYKIMVPFIEKEDMATPQELMDVDLDPTLCNKALFLATGMLQEGKRRCVVYLTDTQTARQFEKVITVVFHLYHGIDIDARTVDHKTPKKRRDDIINNFRKTDLDKIKIICNVRILNEAIDLVPCDCVYKTEPGSNDLTTVQQLGRAIRLDPNNVSKEAVMFIWCNEFDECLNSLQMLKTEDPEFHRRISVKGMTYDKTETNQTKIQTKTQEFIKYVEIKCLTPQEVWEKRRSHWKTQYVNKGNKNPSQTSKDPEKKRAGIWQNTQRKWYKKGKLSEERIQDLNDTPGWTWVDDKFQEQLDHWNTQYAKLGNKKPSSESKDPDQKRAGKWQQKQRQLYKKDKLSTGRIQFLNDTPGWTWEEEDPYQEQLDNWNTQYVNKGNKNPSQSSKDPEEKRAAEWQNRQRHFYKNGKLSTGRIQFLNDTPGWTWEEEDPYQEQLDNWNTQYVNKGNKKPSMTSKDPEEKRAGQWQDRQRQLYKKGKLSAERIQDLNDTSGWTWEEECFTYQEQLDHWKTQYAKKGNNKPSSKTSKDPEEKRAGQWQSDQRKTYKIGKLSADRIEALNNTPGWTWEG